jgi:hypothetical protein
MLPTSSQPRPLKGGAGVTANMMNILYLYLGEGINHGYEALGVTSN